MTTLAHSPFHPPLMLIHLLFFFLLLFAPQNAAVSNYLKLPLLHSATFPTSQLPFRHRHRHRHHHRGSLISPITSGASFGSGQYFVSLHLGTPPQPLLLVADTGSDLVWVKSSPCKHNCSLLHTAGSTFLPRQSSSFSPAHCFNSLCQLVPRPENVTCNHTRLHSPCRYSYSYSDGSTTSGFFSLETATFNTSSGNEINLKGLAFGCGFNVSGPSVTGPSFNGAQGVVGLGRGPISFPSQLGRYFGNKFSYCLMDYTLSPPPTSYLVIGGKDQNDAALEKSKGMRFTPLLTNPLSPTFYYIGVKAVFVNGVKLRINPSVWSIDELGNGGTVIDSGTTLTFFVQPAYDAILKAFERRLKKAPKPAEPVQTGFDLCVNASSALDMKKKLVLPRMSFELAGGATFSPPAGNYFIEVEEGVKCLAVQPVVSEGGFSVIGNLLQQGFLFEFDRAKSRLGFSRRGCGFP